MGTITTPIRPAWAVSEPTAKIIDAMRGFDDVKDNVLSALSLIYSDSQASEIYADRYEERLKTVEDLLTEVLGLSVYENAVVFKESNTI